jgi:hypothetical protein
VQGDQIHGGSFSDAVHGAQRDPHRVAAALVRGAIACVIDQDPPHHHRRHPHELGTVLPVHPALIDQPEIRLVHECGGLQGMTGALADEKRACQPPQFVVHEWQHLFAPLLPAPVPVPQ